MNRPALQVRPAHPAPLAQVELLVLFHPAMQTGGAGRITTMPQNCAQGWLTVDVHGRIGKSELTGRPTIEDMRVEVGGEDIESKLPESVIDGLVQYVVNIT